MEMQEQNNGTTPQADRLQAEFRTEKSVCPLDSGGGTSARKFETEGNQVVGNQATSSDNMTGRLEGTARKKGEGGDETAFRRSSIINRTPPGARTRSLDRPVESKEKHPQENFYLERKEDEEPSDEDLAQAQSRQSKKRKAECSPRTDENIGKEKKVLWGKMMKQIEHLRSIVKACPKIRTDIKRCTEDLQSLMVVLNQLEKESFHRGGRKLQHTDKNEQILLTNVEKKDVLKQTEIDTEKNFQPEKEDMKEKDERNNEERTEENWKPYQSRRNARRDKKQAEDDAEAGRYIIDTPYEQKSRQDNRHQKGQKPKGGRKGEPRKFPQKNPLGRSRLEAILVRPKEGKTFSEVLQTMKGKTRPEECEATVKAVRKTRNGEILVELDKQTKNQGKFSEALVKALGEDATVLTLSRKVSLEIKDMDDKTTTEEVKIPPVAANLRTQ